MTALPGTGVVDQSLAPGLSRDEGVRRAYSADASGLVLVPDCVARPESAAEVGALLAESTSARTPVTAAGSQTSTTAASICDRGILLSSHRDRNLPGFRSEHDGFRWVVVVSGG